MPRRRLTKFDKLRTEYDLRMTEIFIRAMKENQELNADTVWELARRELVPAQEVTGRLAGYFRRNLAGGYLRRTGRFATSTRNDSSPLPWYKSTIFDGGKT